MDVSTERRIDAIVALTGVEPAAHLLRRGDSHAAQRCPPLPPAVHHRRPSALHHADLQLCIAPASALHHRWLSDVHRRRPSAVHHRRPSALHHADLQPRIIGGPRLCIMLGLGFASRRPSVVHHRWP